MSRLRPRRGAMMGGNSSDDSVSSSVSRGGSSGDSYHQRVQRGGRGSTSSSGSSYGVKKNVNVHSTEVEVAKQASSREQPSTSKEKGSQPRRRGAFPIHELFRMLELNVDLSDVKQFTLIPQSLVFEWMIKRVVNPHEFYLEFQFDETLVGGMLAELNYHRWWPRMQAYYNNPLKQQALKMEVKDIAVGRCFAFEGPDPDDANQVKWHRVRVFRILPVEKKALVFLCDMGHQVTADITRLFKLIPEYAQYPAQVYRCYLYQVIPATGSLNWSVEAVAFFKDVMRRLEGIKFSGVVLARSGSEVQRCMPEVFHNLGVVIFEGLDVKHCSVSALMVKSGQAIGTGVFASCPHQLGRPEDPLEGITFEEKKPPRRRLTPPPPDEPFVIKPTDRLYDEKYKKAVELYAAETEPKNKKWLPQEYQDILTGKNLEVCWLPETVKERIGHVHIQNCKGPAKIILHMAKDLKALSDMQNAIGQQLCNATTIRVINPGMFIVFPTGNPDPEEVEENPTAWIRGMILSQIDQKGFCKAITLDYGTVFNVHRNEVYELEKPFSEIPSFAIRAHMAAPGLVPADAGEKWSDRAKQSLLKYLISWEDSSPFYYAYPPIGGEVIQLESLDQEVVLDLENKKWVAAEVGLNTFPTEIRNHPLVKSLFRSFGVQIKYEIMHPHSPFWHFEDLHDDLLLKGEAEMKLKTRSDARVHADIIDEMDIAVLKESLRFYDHDDAIYPNSKDDNAEDDVEWNDNNGEYFDI